MPKLSSPANFHPPLWAPRSEAVTYPTGRQLTGAAQISANGRFVYNGQSFPQSVVAPQTNVSELHDLQTGTTSQVAVWPARGD